MDTKQISSALVKAQKAFGPALKTSSNPHFKSRYADLAACVEAVIDALNANGIALIQRTLPSDSGVNVETVFLHESGERLDCGVLHVPAAKHDPQGYGSALTYARRYSLMAACGIAPEDDDGNAGAKARGVGMPSGPIKPTDGARAAITDPKRRSELDQIANDMIDLHDNGQDIRAIAIWYGEEAFNDNDERVYVWDALAAHSKLRSMLKANKPERKAA